MGLRHSALSASRDASIIPPSAQYAMLHRVFAMRPSLGKFSSARVCCWGARMPSQSKRLVSLNSKVFAAPWQLTTYSQTNLQADTSRYPLRPGSDCTHRTGFIIALNVLDDCPYSTGGPIWLSLESEKADFLRA